jgi:hypothetical protein
MRERNDGVSRSVAGSNPLRPILNVTSLGRDSFSARGSCCSQARMSWLEPLFDRSSAKIAYQFAAPAWVTQFGQRLFLNLAYPLLSE